MVRKYRQAALSTSILVRLHQLCYLWEIKSGDRVRAIKYRAHQILKRA